jgi:serine protease SohB
MKELFGDKVKLVPYGQRRSLLQRFGAQITGSALSEVEDRVLWARFGL